MTSLLPYVGLSVGCSCALHTTLSCKQMKWALQKPEPKIFTISCHRRIRHCSNAQATTHSSAYMWADVALLKLHCRPNDLDCWAETLWKRWPALNLFTAFIQYAGGDAVLLHRIATIVGGQVQNHLACWKGLTSSNLSTYCFISSFFRGIMSMIVSKRASQSQF